VAYKDINEYGVIGNLLAAALVGTDGSIDWFCLPRFDGASVFARVLDDGKGGYFKIATVGECHRRQASARSPGTPVALAPRRGNDARAPARTRRMSCPVSVVSA